MDTKTKDEKQPASKAVAAPSVYAEQRKQREDSQKDRKLIQTVLNLPDGHALFESLFGVAFASSGFRFSDEFSRWLADTIAEHDDLQPLVNEVEGETATTTTPAAAADTTALTEDEVLKLHEKQEQKLLALTKRREAWYLKRTVRDRVRRATMTPFVTAAPIEADSVVATDLLKDILREVANKSTAHYAYLRFQMLKAIGGGKSYAFVPRKAEYEPHDGNARAGLSDSGKKRAKRVVKNIQAANDFLLETKAGNSFWRIEGHVLSSSANVEERKSFALAESLHAHTVKELLKLKTEFTNAEELVAYMRKLQSKAPAKFRIVRHMPSTGPYWQTLLMNPRDEESSMCELWLACLPLVLYHGGIMPIERTEEAYNRAATHLGQLIECNRMPAESPGDCLLRCADAALEEWTLDASVCNGKVRGDGKSYMTETSVPSRIGSIGETMLDGIHKLDVKSSTGMDQLCAAAVMHLATPASDKKHLVDAATFARQALERTVKARHVYDFTTSMLGTLLSTYRGKDSSTGIRVSDTPLPRCDASFVFHFAGDDETVKSSMRTAYQVLCATDLQIVHPEMYAKSLCEAVVTGSGGSFVAMAHILTFSDFVRHVTFAGVLSIALAKTGLPSTQSCLDVVRSYALLAPEQRVVSYRQLCDSTPPDANVPVMWNTTWLALMSEGRRVIEDSMVALASRRAVDDADGEVKRIATRAAATKVEAETKIKGYTPEVASRDIASSLVFRTFPKISKSTICMQIAGNSDAMQHQRKSDWAHYEAVCASMVTATVDPPAWDESDAYNVMTSIPRSHAADALKETREAAAGLAEVRASIYDLVAAASDPKGPHCHRLNPKKDAWDDVTRKRKSDFLYVYASQIVLQRIAFFQKTMLPTLARLYNDLEVTKDDLDYASTLFRLRELEKKYTPLPLEPKEKDATDTKTQSDTKSASVDTKASK